MKKISIPAKAFNPANNPDAHVWVCLSKASLDGTVNLDVPRLSSASGRNFDVVSSELVLKNKINGKETGEEISLYVAIAL
jgi:hypothetical protein